jgi:hypothetical protein
VIRAGAAQTRRSGHPFENSIMPACPERFANRSGQFIFILQHLSYVYLLMTFLTRQMEIGG